MRRFDKNARVVFLGDSITHNWTWVAAIYKYYQDYVDSSVSMYDCGSAGGTAKDAWLYRNIDLYRYDPTHVHIMFGVNDIGRSHYRDDATPDDIKARNERMQIYRKSMTDIVEELLSKNKNIWRSLKGWKGMLCIACRALQELPFKKPRKIKAI